MDINKLKENGWIMKKVEASKGIQDDKTKKYFHIEQKIDKEEILLEQYKEAISKLNVAEKVELIIGSKGLSPSSFTFQEKMMLIVRLIPFCEKSYHLIELGGPGTGKSATYQKLSPNSYLFSGEPTEASFFGDKRKKDDKGFIGTSDVFAMDEIAELNNFNKELATKLRTFLTDGEISRDKENSFISNTSIVLLGNLKGNQEVLLDQGNMISEIDLFQHFPEELKGNPMKDRFAYLIPGWNIKIGQSNYAKDKDYGMNSNYFSEILHQLREKDFKVNFASLKNKGNRELQSIKSTVKGFIKLIFPNEDYTSEDLEAIITLAEFGRDLISGKYTNIFGKKSMKIFALKVIEKDLKEISKKDMMEIEEVYFYKNRVLVKYIDDENFYKIALNREGKIENEKEYRAWNEKLSFREIVAPIKEKGESYMYITQQYGKLESENKLLTNWKEELKKKPSAYLEIEDIKLKKALQEIVDYYESALLSEKNKTEILEKESKNMSKKLDQNEEDIDEHFRKLKLEIMELMLKIEELEKSDNFYGIDLPQHAGFSFRKISKKLNETASIEKIKNILNAKKIEKENYSIDFEGQIKLINFANDIQN